MAFKVNSRVSYKTPRQPDYRPGKVIAIHNTARGDWYEVVDTETKEHVRVRAAGLIRL